MGNGDNGEITNIYQHISNISAMGNRDNGEITNTYQHISNISIYINIYHIGFLYTDSIPSGEL